MSWVEIKYQDYDGTIAATNFACFLLCLKIESADVVTLELEGQLDMFCSDCMSTALDCECHTIIDLDRKYDEYKDRLGDM